MPLPPRPHRLAWLAWSVAMLMLAAVAVRLAWLGDDAFITLRSVENWARGDGLRWNTNDRVQTFTHPLWCLLLAAGRALTGECWATTLTISLALSLGAVGWLFARARTTAAIVATTALLLSARAFGDYMTSGLETPLTFVLLIALVGVVLADSSPLRRFTLAVLVTAWLVTNRMDLGLLCLPACLATMAGVPRHKLLLHGALACLPLVAWLAFACFYYGSALPITAQAKAFGLGIPAADLAHQGLLYLWHTANTDPCLFAVTLLGALVLLLPRRSRWLALGSLLYVAYLVKVGGDFMQGRLLLAPFVVVVASALPHLTAQGWRLAAPTSLLALALLLTGGLPAWCVAPAADTPSSQDVIDTQHGIVDERRMYYASYGLLSPTRSLPPFGGLQSTAFPEGRTTTWFMLHGLAGAVGFGAGALGHIVDPLLCDPLLARLPAKDRQHWRIGHVLRRIPEGYWESLRSGDNLVHHAGLRRFYATLRQATQGPLLAGERWHATARLLLGLDNDGLLSFVAEHYYQPPRITVAAADVGEELPLGTFWFDAPRTKVLYEGGLEVTFPAAVTATTLQVQVSGLCGFRYRFRREGAEVGAANGIEQPPPAGVEGLRSIAGLRLQRVLVPPTASGFDTLWIDAVELPQSGQAIGPAAIGAVTPVL